MIDIGRTVLRIFHRYNSNIVLIRLRGGIGNQLFIYFGGLYIGQSLGCKIIFDTRGIDHQESIEGMSLPGHFMSNRFFLKLVDIFFTTKSKVIDFDVQGIEAINTKMNFIVPVDGFFQSKTYYESIVELGTSFKGIYGNCLDPAKFDVSVDSALIHIRGGDFKILNEDVGCLGLAYYSEVRKIINLKGLRNIYVTTDDEDYANQVLSDAGFREYIFLEKEGMRSYECLNYFRYFNTIFLANSTFSWWGAQLAPNKANVYAPNIWFRKYSSDKNPLFCQNWIALRSIWSD